MANRLAIISQSMIEQTLDELPADHEAPYSIGSMGGLFAGLPRIARAALMLDRCAVGHPCGNRENLEALAALLESGDVKVVIDKVYPLSLAADAVAHMLGHHARGNLVIAA